MTARIIPFPAPAQAEAIRPRDRVRLADGREGVVIGASGETDPATGRLRWRIMVLVRGAVHYLSPHRLRRVM